jgi:iron complex transport system ATP-binding protein
MSGERAALEAREVTCGYDGRAVLDSVDIVLRRGEFLSLVGPNGSGKTTLLRALAGVLRADSGEVLLEGRAIGSYARYEIARRIAVVPQMSAAAFDFSVSEIVRMGRTPHLGRLQSERPADREAVAEALALTDTERLAGRLVTELSGGELQRVMIARALAQQSPIMLLDEPAAFLDISHQLRTFDLLARLNAEQGRSILCVSHDLNLAAEYSGRVVLLDEGHAVADGPPSEVITSDWITRVYGCRVEVDVSPSGRPRVTLLSRENDGGGGEA